MNVKDKLTVLGALVYVVAVIAIPIAGLVGWGMNLYKFAKSDFEAPYKAEVLRGVGIFVAPMGAVEGYLNIKD